MSSQDFSPASVPAFAGNGAGLFQRPAVRTRPRYWLHGLLFAATLFTTTVVGAGMMFDFQRNLPYDIDHGLNALFAIRAHPSIPSDIEHGRFATLHGWLRENVYQHGAKLTASELTERATGSPMSIEPYIKYLWKKYQPLYDLEGEPVGAS